MVILNELCELTSQLANMLQRSSSLDINFVVFRLKVSKCFLSTKIQL